MKSSHFPLRLLACWCASHEGWRFLEADGCAINPVSAFGTILQAAAGLRRWTILCWWRITYIFSNMLWTAGVIPQASQSELSRRERLRVFVRVADWSDFMQGVQFQTLYCGGRHCGPHSRRFPNCGNHHELGDAHAGQRLSGGSFYALKGQVKGVARQVRGLPRGGACEAARGWHRRDRDRGECGPLTAAGAQALCPLVLVRFAFNNPKIEGCAGALEDGSRYTKSHGFGRKCGNPLGIFHPMIHADAAQGNSRRRAEFQAQSWPKRHGCHAGTLSG